MCRKVGYCDLGIFWNDQQNQLVPNLLGLNDLLVILTYEVAAWMGRTKDQAPSNEARRDERLRDCFMQAIILYTLGLVFSSHISYKQSKSNVISSEK